MGAKVRVRERHLFLLVAAVVLSGLLVSAPAIWAETPGDGAGEMAPSLQVVTKRGGPVLRAGDTGDVVYILGAGFKPNQPVELNMEINRIPVNINGMLSPEPVANDKGAFVSIWEISKGMYRKTVFGQSGLWTITAVDANGNPLVSAPFGVCDPKQPKEKRDPWCLLAGVQEAKP